jgi:hypothetical protein
MLNLAVLTRVDDENSLTTLEQEREILRTKTKEAISFANVVMKIRYDQIKTSMQFNINDFVYLTLHKEYIQIDLINKKFSKQRSDFVKIIEKMNNFVYKLDVSSIWKIHSIVFIIHLKSTSSNEDSYQRQITKSRSIENVQNDFDDYEVKRILVKWIILKRRSRRSIVQYRVKWLNWEDQYNQWMNKKKMNNQNFIANYEKKRSSQ